MVVKNVRQFLHDRIKYLLFHAPFLNRQWLPENKTVGVVLLSDNESRDEACACCLGYPERAGREKSRSVQKFDFVPLIPLPPVKCYGQKFVIPDRLDRGLQMQVRTQERNGKP